MSRRFWIALAIGGLVGGGAIAGFQPLVESRLEQTAARYGAEVSVRRVVPGLDGIRLRGVEVHLADLPGVRVTADEVLVGWGEKRPRAVRGGRVEAVGSVEDLSSRFETWRARLSGGGGTEGNGGSQLSLEGFDLDWRDRAEDPTRSVVAHGVRLSRSASEGGGQALELAADSAEAHAAELALTVEGGRVLLHKDGSAYRIAELATRSLVLEYSAGALPVPVADGEMGGLGDGEKDRTSPQLPIAPAPHRPDRVALARRVHAWLRQAATAVDALIEPDGRIAVAGARAQLAVGGEHISLGPGTLGVGREEGRLLLELAPDLVEEAATNKRGLTFSVRIPLPKASATAAAGSGAPARASEDIVAELRGGPVFLSTLGLRDGDLGLVDVARASIESEARVVLPADGESVSLDGRGKLHRLSISHPRLADGALAAIELAWRAKGSARLDGTSLELEEGEIDLGDVRLLVRGRYKSDASSEPLLRRPNERLDFDFDVPLVSCQQAFDSLPKAIVPDLAGMRFVGSLAAQGHVRLGTANLARDYDVDWGGSLSCRVLEAPPAVDAQRFRSAFEKIVYTPEGEQRKATFGPEAEGWAPLSSISHYMIGAVLTTEDGRFFRHGGFDQEAIVNSIRENLKERRFVRGASTISMQLAKNLYLTREKTLSRKLEEAILTLYLEQQLTKNELMELYLNVIEFGPMVYGIGPAARHYFNTSAGHLSLSQSMYLASILRNPKKQYFGAGGAVSAGYVSYLRRLMKITEKIGRISEEELELGLRETPIFGSPSPQVAPPEEQLDPEAGAGGGDQDTEGEPIWSIP